MTSLSLLRYSILFVILTISACTKQVNQSLHRMSNLADTSSIDSGGGTFGSVMGATGSILNGAWGNEFFDNSKPDHFVYSYKLCDNPVPSVGGANCVAENQYTLISSGDLLREEKKTASCVLGYALVGGSCLEIVNGQWGSLSLDYSKPDFFIYEYKLCNSPSPQNGGVACAKESTFDDLVSSLPQREERKTGTCISGYVLSGSTCVKTTNGQWGAITSDYSNPDHFERSYRLCTAPTGGGSNCIVETGYTLVAGSSPLREEKTLASCIPGYSLSGSVCVQNVNGGWGPVTLDNTKSDHFVYEYKLCNSPSPSGTGLNCAQETGYNVVAASSPLREEVRTSSCVSSYYLVGGACVSAPSYAATNCGLMVTGLGSISLHDVLLKNGSAYDIFDNNGATARLVWDCNGPSETLNNLITNTCGLDVPNPGSISLNAVLLKNNTYADLWGGNSSTAILRWTCGGSSTLAEQLNSACGFDVINPGSASLNAVLLKNNTYYDLYDENGATAVLRWKCN